MARGFIWRASHAGTDRAGATARAAPANTEAFGKTLFTAQGCAACHAHVDVKGSGQFASAHGAGNAPSLTLREFSVDYLRLWLRDPKAIEPATLMPKVIEYVDDDARYRVNLPVSQTWVRQKREVQTGGRTLLCCSLLARHNGAYFRVETCDAPAMPASELLRWAQEDAMRISISRPLTQSRFTARSSAGEGVQVIAESDTRGTGAYDGKFLMRAFVDDNTVYTVSSFVFNETGSNRRAWVMPFLDSLQIWKR